MIFRWFFNIKYWNERALRMVSPPSLIRSLLAVFYVDPFQFPENGSRLLRQPAFGTFAGFFGSNDHRHHQILLHLHARPLRFRMRYAFGWLVSIRLPARLMTPDAILPGLNQLMWYYADLEKNKCYSLPGGLPDLENNAESCFFWRRFAKYSDWSSDIFAHQSNPNSEISFSLFETSQSLFWASFGLVDLQSFELTGCKSFTRFWGLLMFGSYSVINVIVLLNMLIAMMSSSYQTISVNKIVRTNFSPFLYLTRRRL